MELLHIMMEITSLVILSEDSKLLTNFNDGSIACEKPVVLFDIAKKLHFRARGMKLSLDGLMRVL